MVNNHTQIGGINPLLLDWHWIKKRGEEVCYYYFLKIR